MVRATYAHGPGYGAPLDMLEETSASLGIKGLPRGQMGDTAKS